MNQFPYGHNEAPTPPDSILEYTIGIIRMLGGVYEIKPCHDKWHVSVSWTLRYGDDFYSDAPPLTEPWKMTVVNVEEQGIPFALMECVSARIHHIGMCCHHWRGIVARLPVYRDWPQFSGKRRTE